MALFLSMGECMVELSEAEGGLWKLGVAGDTLNTAWYARRALPEGWQVAYFTRLGADHFSAHMRDFIERAGIGTEFIGSDPARNPGLYAISLDKGERSFTYWRSASAARHLADDEAALGAALDAADLVYLSGITLAILAPERRAALLAAIAARKLPLAFDPNIRPKLWESPAAAREWISRAAAAAHYALPSYDDEAALFGDASPAETLARYAAAPDVVVKNGGGPIHWQSGGETGVTEGLPRVQPVDTTGAGDSFNAAFLAARLAGKAMPAAIGEGHALAARVVTVRGALME